jgi:hypothetical protein
VKLDPTKYIDEMKVEGNSRCLQSFGSEEMLTLCHLLGKREKEEDCVGKREREREREKEGEREREDERKKEKKVEKRRKEEEKRDF